MKPYTILAVVQPGLEAMAQQEINALGYQDLELTKGGIFLKGHQSTLIKLNLACRTLSRVLIELAVFEARSFAQLEHYFDLIPWQDYIEGQNVCIRVSSFQSALYHEKAISERLIDSLAYALDKPLTVVGSPDEENTQLIVVHVLHDKFTVRMDSSGAHLHKRGYGIYKEDAPLRETVAAAMLMAVGWNQTEFHLCDPMCGSGTIPIEAALQSKRIPLSEYREFAMQKWPSFQPSVFEKVRQELLSRVIDTPQVSITGSDIDPKAVSSATHNAVAAGVDGLVRLSVSDLSEINIDKINLVITNPPWGKRIGADSIRSVWKDLEKMAKRGLKVYLTLPEWQTEDFPYRYHTLLSFAAGAVKVKFILLEVK